MTPVPEGVITTTTMWEQDQQAELAKSLLAKDDERLVQLVEEVLPEVEDED